MKVKCLATEPTKEQLVALGESYLTPQTFEVTTGAEYVVIGSSFRLTPSGSGRGAIAKIRNDYGDLVSVPLVLFEIVDPRVSRYWIVRQSPDGNVQVAPRSLIENPYYADDLSNSVPAVIEDFNRVMDELLAEANGD